MQPAASRPPHPSAGAPPVGMSVGSTLVLSLLALAVGLGMFAVWFQWGQTRKCLAFFGAEAARQIQTAPRVELWSLDADGQGVWATARLDVSKSAGLVHLRRGLIEDVNYRWDAAETSSGDEPPGPLAAGRWTDAIAFYGSPEDQTAATILAFDLDRGGHATVVGRGGRVAMGRLAEGLRRWIKATRSGFSAEKSGY